VDLQTNEFDRIKGETRKISEIERAFQENRERITIYFGRYKREEIPRNYIFFNKLNNKLKNKSNLLATKPDVLYFFMYKRERIKILGSLFPDNVVIK
jgi:hypothetical protein